MSLESPKIFPEYNAIYGGIVVFFKKKPVVCEGCAYFIVTQLGGENGSCSAECLATARFIAGPLREAIDLEGMESAYERNANNDCKYRRRRSSLSFRMKEWIIETGGDLVDLLPLDAIPLSDEITTAQQMKAARYYASKAETTIAEVPQPKKEDNHGNTEAKIHKTETAQKARETGKTLSKKPGGSRRRSATKSLEDLGPGSPQSLKTDEFLQRAISGFQKS